MLKKALRAARARWLSPALMAIHSIERRLDESSRRSILLQGRQAAHVLRCMKNLGTLADAEFQAYSQWGEDGILEWLIQRLPIASNRFIEFGVESYKEANTRFLLINRNWKGLIMDSSADNMRTVRQDEIYWRYDLKAVPTFVDRDNINELISKNGFTGKLGVLSIDMDGNDYWVWEAIEAAAPDIVVCEYNAVFGDIYPISIPYAPDFFRTRAHASNLYFGASINALCLLAARKGYELVGTNRAGVNAFFVRRDMVSAIDSCIVSKEPFHSSIRESRDENGRPTFVSGLERSKLIADMPVVRVDTKEKVKLRELQPLYSQRWLEAMER
jgi:hypothetical protein